LRTTAGSRCSRQPSMFAAMGLALCAAIGVGLLAPRRKWGWVYALVVICLGLTSCCTMPACIPLLIFWLKPETKAYYNM